MSTRLISHKPVQVSAGQKEYGGVPGWLCFSSINVFGVPRRKMPFEVLQLLTYQLTINDDKKLSQYPTPLKFTAGGHKKMAQKLFVGKRKEKSSTKCNVGCSSSTQENGTTDCGIIPSHPVALERKIPTVHICTCLKT